MPSLLFVHALSPLHAGTGHSVGAVDLPIARDKATGFPYVPGSSIKGVLRDAARGWETSQLHAVFGPERDHASDHGGSLLVGDANLLLLPVRSLVGTFAWATNPWLLRRFSRDVREAEGEALVVPSVDGQETALTSSVTSLQSAQRVVFEDLDFVAKASPEVDKLADWLGRRLFPDGTPDADAWRGLLKKKLCVLSDDAMSFFSEHGTDIVTRIAINPDTKTVKDGALWTEESLPTESVLVSLVAGQANGKIKDAATAVERVRPLLARSLQLGGDATTGRGRCRLVLGGGAK
jgi:CRISPR-associated protein Cmr4